MNEAAEADEAARLAVTVTQLEHALTARVRVEQAIGVLAERHRLRTRDAFDLLRNAARSRGRRVIDIAEDVVNSTANSLLRLPEELERKPEPRARIRSARRSRRADSYRPHPADLPTAGVSVRHGRRPIPANCHRAALTSRTGHGAAARAVHRDGDSFAPRWVAGAVGRRRAA